MIPELDAIKNLLLDDWDPIGVAGIMEPIDEYDGYALPVWSLLREGAGVEQIADYLDWVVTARMGLSSNGATSRIVAQNLLTLHDSYKSSEA